MARIDELRAHAEQNRLLAKELARRLADNAEATADHLDRLADIHESIAASEHHPLRSSAKASAARQRQFAQQERQAAATFRRTTSPSAEPVAQRDV